jgi:cytoskeletal protein CcmA (bactofilin family)
MRMFQVGVNQNQKGILQRSTADRSITAMREERENLAGPVTINESLDLHGNVGGTITIVKGGKVYIRGGVYGSLIAADGGRVHLLGHVRGDVIVEEGSKAILSGAVGGDVINHGGRLYVHATAHIMGKWKIGKGKNEFETGANRPDWYAS